jgi:succinoglycan biosynthesis transport protein ExoP
MAWTSPHTSDSDARGAAAAESHFVDYLRLLSKRRWTAAIVFAIVMVTVAWITFTATPVYEGSAQLLIEAESQNVITFKEVVEQERTTADYYQTQYKILQSRALAKATIQTLNLWNNPEFGIRPAGEEPKPSRIARLIDPVLSAASRALRPITGAPEASPVAAPEAPGTAETAEQSRVISGFLQRLTIAPVRNSRLVDLRFRSTDPARAAAAANALAKAFIDRTLEFKFLASKEASDWLANQLGEQRKRVEESEAALQRYREREGAFSTDEPQLTQKLAELNTAVTRAKTTRIEKETIFRQLEKVRANQQLDESPLVLGSSAIQSLRGRLAELDRDLSARSQRLGARHPDIIKLNADIAAVRTQIREEVDNVFNTMKNDYLTAALQERQLLEAVGAVKADLVQLNRTGTEYRALDREVTSNRQIFDTLLQRAKETGISGELRSNNIRIADEASQPRSPVWPRKQRNMLFGMLGGFGLAVCMAFVAEYLDDKLKSPEEIRRELRLPCLGLVPKIKNDGKHAHMPLLNNGVPPVFAESFRAVRTNVLFAAADSRRTLLVTSSRPGEGKSLVASNLAVGLALAGQRVLIIDADMRRPQVHTILNTEQTPGLSDLLGGTAIADNVIRRTTIEGLSVLPSGVPLPNPAELLSSDRLAQLIAALRERFDWVVIDSPPVLAVTDASLLAHACSGVVFVVAAEKTDRPTALKAIEQLDGANAQFLGAVLNQVDLTRNAFFYAPYYRRDYTAYYAKSGTV